MHEPTRPTRPAPRTPAAVEAELRRRVRAELEETRGAGGGELSDVALANIIARAIGQALAWHVDAPEHARGPTTSGGWRPAPGPRGQPRPDDRDRAAPTWRDRGPRPFKPNYRDQPGPGPSGNRPRPNKGGGYKPRKPG
jgi:hypothetical protein